MTSTSGSRRSAYSTASRPFLTVPTIVKVLGKKTTYPVQNCLMIVSEQHSNLAHKFGVP